MVPERLEFDLQVLAFWSREIFHRQEWNAGPLAQLSVSRQEFWPGFGQLARFCYICLE